MDIVLLGPPGAGKGTQAERLEKELGLPHVSSGDLFRENLKNETELGLLAKEFIDQGKLVPDDVTIAMVRDRIQRPDCGDGVILDGFPRTQAQAEGLDRMLANLGRKLDGVLYMAVPEDELVRRLSGRWLCSQCQTPYHNVTSPPGEPGVCDVCGGDLYQRDDDRPETVRARLGVYSESTAPLIDYYRERRLLVEVDGSGSIDAVGAALLDAVCGLREQATRLKPRIESTKFGSITIDGRKIRGDVIIRLDGSIEKRKKKLSKQVYGTSHTISLEEARHVYAEGAEVLVIGTGQQDLVRLSDAAEAYLKEHDCQVVMAASPEAVEIWNQATGKAIGLFHVTC